MGDEDETLMAGQQSEPPTPPPEPPSSAPSAETVAEAPVAAVVIPRPLFGGAILTADEKAHRAAAAIKHVAAKISPDLARELETAFGL